MKYKIDIWQWGSITETYESDNIEDIVEFWKGEWFDCYDHGYCTFYVYEDDEELSFDEVYELGMI